MGKPHVQSFHFIRCEKLVKHEEILIQICLVRGELDAVRGKCLATCQKPHIRDQFMQCNNLHIIKLYQFFLPDVK
jgi:hypothetical protein